MLKNYIKVAWSNIRKDIAFSFINVFGLALGISLCLVLITIIKDQLGFDRFHPDAANIYRINTEAIRKDGGRERYASAPFLLGEELKTNYPFVKEVVQLSGRMREKVVYNEKQLLLDGFFSGQEFFNVFGFNLLFGDKSSALTQPNSIVLTENAASKFFGDENPVGKIITLKGLDDFTISGVIKRPPGKTHFEFDMLISSIGLPMYEKEEKAMHITDDWKNYYANHLYVLLKDKKSASTLENEFVSISKAHYDNVVMESRDKGYRFYLQPLNKIVPGPMLSNNLGKALPSQLLWAIGVLALIVLISAGFNYNSLSLAKSLSRAKEIGIRKVSGALRHQLVLQFLTESVFTSLLAFLLAALLFHFFLRPIFEGLTIFQEMNVELHEDPALYGLFALFCILIGLISGIFPAWYLSSFSPSEALKNLKGKMWMPKLGFRKALLVTQFAAALLFTISLINIFRQLSYVADADYGFKKDNIINIELQGNEYAKFSTAIAQNSDVVKVSGISHSLGTWQDRDIDVRIKEADEKFAVRDYSIDANYISNLEIQLVAGKNFTSDIPADRELFAIVNESFLKRFELGTPSEALTKSILVGDSMQLSIIGVVKDFHFKPFTYSIEPLLLRYNTADITQLNVQIAGADASKTVAQLEKTWKRLDKAQPFTYNFFSDELRDTYKEYNDITYLLQLVALMSVIVACLGFLGLVIMLAKQRIKEISIRKVLGASVWEITSLLSKSFIRLLIIACLIGLPLSILVNTLIMGEFAYRTNSFTGYAGGVILLLFIALLTISSEIFRAATVNPVKSLRTE
ncbi:MAG: ABC transporter permease [Chitinophagales bacterium]